MKGCLSEMPRSKMQLTEMERVAGFEEPPQTVSILVPVKLELFNKLYETCLRERSEVKEKITEILEVALSS